MESGKGRGIREISRRGKMGKKWGKKEKDGEGGMLKRK